MDPIVQEEEIQPQVALMTPAVETTTSFVQPSPGMNAAMQDLAAAGQAQIAAADQYGNVLAENAPAMEAVAQQKADLALQGLNDQDARDAAFKEDYAKMRGLVDKQTAELENTKPESFWSDNTVFKSLVAGMAIYLGGKAGKSDQALDRINDIVARDLVAQTNAYERKAKALERRKGDLSDMLSMQDRVNAQAMARQTAAMSQLDAVANVIGTKNLNAEQQQKLQALKANIAQEIAASKLDVEKQLSQHVTRKTTEQAVMKGQGAIPYNMLPQDQKEAIKVISNKNANIAAIQSEISSGLKQLQDPNLSQDDKIRVGQGLVKTLNSTQGADAVGAEEAKRLASELESNAGKIGVGATGGASAGALAGGFAGSAIPVVGNIAGGIAGGILGGISGAAVGLFDAMNDPGGVRFRPDVDGFAKRVELTSDKLKATMEKNEKITQLMKAGKPAAEASMLADKWLETKLKLQAEGKGK